MALKKFLMIGVVAGLLVACGDEVSDKSPVQVAEESSSSVDEVLSSSANVEESSSSVESEGLSSSVESGASSSSEKSTESSSGKNTEPAEVSSCSVAEESSSSMTVEPSSSSVKAEQSSSSEKVVEPSSSSKVQESSSSVKVEESSSSAKTDASSSSEKPAESSSSEKVAESSSSEKSSSSAGIPSKIYDCNEYNCVPTTYLNPDIEYGELLDTRDNQVYRTVEIGTQTWMAQNLNYKVEHSFCLKQKDSLCVIYGRYYPFSVAMDSVNQGGCGNGEGCERQISHQGICPNGWHLPDSLEFDYFIKFISKDKNEKYFSRAVRSKMLWSDSMGLDEFGFSLLPTGRVLFAKYDGSYAYSKSEHKQYICLWGNGWKKDGPNENTGYTIVYRGGKIQVEDNGYVFLLGDNLWETDQITSQAFNVRCVKNN